MIAPPRSASRLVLACLASTILVASFLVPIADFRTGAADRLAERAPVTPVLHSFSLAGIDESAIADSAVSMASWDELVGDVHVESLGLAPLPESAASNAARATEVAAPARAPLRPAIATAQTSTEGFGLVGITTASPLDATSRVLVRVRESDGWSNWTPLPVSEHAPDPGSLEAQGVRFGTEPLITGESDGVQVRIDTPGGEAPVDPQVMLMNNPVVDEDADIPLGPRTDDLPISTVAAATIGAPMPTIITRAEWGANESLRRAGPTYSGTIKAAFLHHTVTSNSYSPEESAQQVRNLYGWFVKGLRYSDMAYNFLVDRFGRLYEGRAGGIDQPVIGGHTAGFNKETFAVSAVGNFQSKNPAAEEMAVISESVAQLMAWKLSMSHRDPNGTAVLVSDSSAGTSKYQPGQEANALVIGGHRDIGQTACPGRYLEPQIPMIRAMVASKMGVTTFNPAMSAPAAWGSSAPLALTTTTTAPLTWTVAITSKCGAQVRTLSGQQEAGGPLTVAWDKLDDSGAPVAPGTYTLTLSGSSNGDAIFPWVGTGVIPATATSPIDPCAPPGEFTLNGSGYGHGIGMSQWGAYGMALEGKNASEIVSHYYSGTTVEPTRDDMDIQVNLLYQVQSAQARAEALEQGGGAVEVTVGGTSTIGGPDDVFAFNVSGSSVGVRRIAGGTAIDLGSAPTVKIRWAGTREPGGAAGPRTLLNLIGPSGTFGSSGHRYRDGSIDITAVNTSSGVRLNAVNSVRMHDEYLFGISEVSSSWPEAAMQAQAIAARSYGLSKMADGIRKSCSCHVDDGGGPFIDQTFTGWAKQSGPKGNRWANAVQATNSSDTTSLTVLYKGKPIKAFYTSSTGGATTSVKDVWGGDLPYAVSVDDRWALHPDNTNRTWTVKVSQSAAAKAFGVPDVWKLTVGDRLSSGAAKTVTATLQDGSQRSMAATEARTAFGLKSTYISSIDGAAGASGGSQAAPGPGGSEGSDEAASTSDDPVASVGGIRVTMKIGPTLRPRAGTSVRFFGKVRPKKGAKGIIVERQMLVDGSWVVKDRTRTNKSGRYSFRIKKAVPAGATLSYRVVVIRKGEVVASSDEQAITVRPKRKR